MFSKNKILISTFILLFIIAFYVFTKIDTPQHQNLNPLKTAVKYNATTLVSSYLNKEDSLQKKLSGKVIEVEGVVKKVSFLNNRNTVILQTSNASSGVICDFEPKQLNNFKKIVVGQKVIIKGICKGFLKDVILLNCYLISNQTNE